MRRLPAALGSGENSTAHPFGDWQPGTFRSRADHLVLVGRESQLSDDGARVVAGRSSGSGHGATLAHTKMFGLGVAPRNFRAYDKSMTTTQMFPTGTYSATIGRMVELADQLEAMGNHEGAADVRNDIAELTAPRPAAQVRCDSCGHVVTSKRQADKYDALGVDWLLCTKCEAK